MKLASPEFNSAFLRDEMYLDHKVVVEFGSNRFNDGQVVTASSTKQVNRGIDSLANQKAEFWKPEDVFNNKNYNTMKWLVCDAGAPLNDVEDGSGYRAIHLDSDDTVVEFERGWWSDATSNASGFFTTPQWVQSEFYEKNGSTPFQRRSNKIVLYLTEGYQNMRVVSVEYKNVAGDWIFLANQVELGVSEYEFIVHDTVGQDGVDDLIITGLRVTVHQTRRSGDWARISELNAFWIKDISEYVVNADLVETRESYDKTVPIGTTAANTLGVELDNTEGLFNVNNKDSIYSPYIGANCRVEFSLGIDVNSGSGVPSYEYVQMGEFWTDEWVNDSSGASARFTSRDFSKFLQDDFMFWGRVWRNTNVIPVMRDVLLMIGMPLHRIHIDESNLRGYQLIFIDDETPWSLFGELALADQGMFGFNNKGDFEYMSYNALSAPPYDNPSFSLNWNTNILDGRLITEIFLNKATVNVSPYRDTEIGIHGIWGSESPVILSWSELATSISESSRTITVRRSERQQTENLTENLWVDKNGYIFIPEYSSEVRGGKRFPTVSGGELIKYKSRSDNQFFECERGYLDTVPKAWPSGTYLGEARVWDLEFDAAPAFTVRYPYVTAIDTLMSVPWEGEPQAHVVHWNSDAFRGKLAIGNIVKWYTWLAGSAQTLKDFDIKEEDREYSSSVAVSGEVAKETGRGKKTKIDSPTANNADLIRRYGKNEVEIDNSWIQAQEHAEDIADSLISEYSYPRQVIDIETIVPPTIELGDMVRITNFPQLDIENRDYHVMKISYSYDGGIKASLTLREAKQ